LALFKSLKNTLVSIRELVGLLRGCLLEEKNKKVLTNLLLLLKQKKNYKGFSVLAVGTVWKIAAEEFMKMIIEWIAR
jgi:hypothetical protein